MRFTRSVFFFGFTKKRFYNFKRVVSDKNIGPIVKTVMTRCIHCTRCVRFADEIAGISDLGVFGRGKDSEIGTYVSKTFSSELSGNIIDLCPVGALTLKPYSFTGRVWELKSCQSIDFSDGFAVNIQLYLKNGLIIKTLPRYNPDLRMVNWISDKTRFGFDGMFSSTRAVQGYFLKSSGTIVPTSWQNLFKEVIHILYFYDHLNRHKFKYNSILLCFNSDVSIEVLNLLYILTKKYSCFQLKKTERLELDNDLETNFLTKLQNEQNLLESSNLGFLIGTNTRYEGFSLNLKLRQRFIKGNFKLISLGSIIDLTYPIAYLGFNLKLLKTIVEGNNFFCQELVDAKNPFLLYSSELLKRKDSTKFEKLLNMLNRNLNNVHPNWSNLHVLNTSLNSAGTSYLNNFDSVSEVDLKDVAGVYCINTNLSNTNIKKLIDYKLLFHIRDKKKTWPFFIEQNNRIPESTALKLKTFFNVSNYINIPNNVFFETSGTYITTQGYFKKVIKVVSSTNQSKENWQIIRKLLSYTKTINFINDSKYNNRLTFSGDNILNFQNYIGFNFYSIRNLIHLNLSYTKAPCSFSFNKSFYKTKRVKVFETKVRIWLDDFFLGGKDSYSKHSLIMIKCSKILRNNSINFKYIV